MHQHPSDATIGMRCVSKGNGTWDLSYTINRVEQEKDQIRGTTREKAVEYRDWLLNKFGRIDELIGCDACLEGPNEIRVRLEGTSDAPVMVLFKGTAVSRVPLPKARSDDRTRAVGEAVLRNLGLSP